MNRKDRMLAALERIAKHIPSGELLLASDSCAFMEIVAECFEMLAAEVAKNAVRPSEKSKLG